MSDTAKTFAALGVKEEICSALSEMGMETAFPIQEMTLPLALSGADIIGQARTGTGKTYGFGLPVLHQLDLDKGLQGLIIVPTRELCMQVAEDLKGAGRKLGAKITAIYGGVSMEDQITVLDRGVHVIVGTPGRLLDLHRRNLLDLSDVKFMVLDEADEMLDLGFLPDVEELISSVNNTRQTMLFSATLPPAIIALGRRYMNNPTFLKAESTEDITTPEHVEQYFFLTHRMNKSAICARILSAPDVDKAVVFCSTKRMADKLAIELNAASLNVRAIHSGLTQDKRERTLKQFRSGKLSILCATEVAARGLDIDDVTHVINFDTPDDEKMYLHRIGRTGRAGHDGVAVTLVLHNELPRMQMILRELEIEADIPEMFSTSPELVEIFDLGPVNTPKKRTNAYGTVSYETENKNERKRSRRRLKDSSSNTSDETAKERSTDDAALNDSAPKKTRTRRRTRIKTVQDSVQDKKVEQVKKVEEVKEDTGRRVRTKTIIEAVPTSKDDEKTAEDSNHKGSKQKNSAAEGNTYSNTKERVKKSKGRSRGGANRRGYARNKPVIDSETARGEGTPTLRRPLKIEFLP